MRPRILAGLLVPLLWGCASVRIELEELPETPIALVYRSAEEGRQLAELQQRAEETQNERRPGQLSNRHPNLIDLTKVGDLLAGNANPFARYRELQGRVVLLDPRSEERIPVDAMLRGARPVEWSRDHTRLLFVSPRRKTPHVYELVMATGEVRPITTGQDSHLMASYGPDERLAWSVLARRSGQLEARIEVTEALGARPRAITAGPLDVDPVWSPDGKSLVYVSSTGRGVQSIVRVALEAGGVPQIIARGGLDPVYAPNGEWIVYCAAARDGYRLWRMRPDGSGKLPLGQGSLEERSPTISPDGRFVAYVAEEQGRQRLRVRRFDGSGDRLLLDDGDGSFPVW